MAIGWDKLNAYVDGELDAQGNAEVAGALALDPDLAARVASLARLKACVAEAGESEMPPPVRSPARSVPPRRSFAWVGVAGAATVVLAVALMSFERLRPAPAPPAPARVLELSGLSAAAAMYDRWIAGNDGGGDQQRPLDWQPMGHPPDLGEARLRLVYRDATEPRDRHAVFYGYLGPNGCRLGLWIGRGEYGGRTSPPQAVHLGELAGYVWTAEWLEYAVVARGMDPVRLASLAAIIERIIERDMKLDRDVRLALQNAARTGATCS